MIFWQAYKYKNLTLFFFSLIFAFVFSKIDYFHSSLLYLESFEYLGVFLAGVLFVSIFTVSTGILILFYLSQNLSPLEISFIAGLGAVFGDFVIFRFVKNHLVEELKDIYTHLDKGSRLKKIFYSKYFSWTLPVIGAIIIASPLPDELGVSLMGLSKIKTYQFLILSFILNTIGIFLVISAFINF